jgi:hypothetical protein
LKNRNFPPKVARSLPAIMAIFFSITASTGNDPIEECGVRQTPTPGRD